MTRKDYNGEKKKFSVQHSAVYKPNQQINGKEGKVKIEEIEGKALNRPSRRTSAGEPSADI